MQLVHQLSLDPEQLNPTYSEIVHAELDGREIRYLNWIGLLREVVEDYYDYRFNTDKQSRESILGEIKETSNIVAGDNSGTASWVYSSRARLSIQGEDARDCWAECRKHAERLGSLRDASYSLVLTVRWKNVQGAQFPGDFA